MDTTLTLGELRHRSVEVEPHEAVAIARSLMGRTDTTAEAHAPFGPLSLDSVAIGADGSVNCRATAATPSVPEIAILLDALLCGSATRVPGGLRYTIGRALHEVEAPPFDSLEEFSAALERFERGERVEVIAALHQRAVPSHLRGMQTDRREPGVERRRHGLSSADLRRELREADLRLYETRRTTAGAGKAASDSTLRFRAPVAACMVAGIVMVAFGELGRTHSPAAAEAASATVSADSASQSVVPTISSLSAPAVLMPASAGTLPHDLQRTGRVIPARHERSTAAVHPPAAVRPSKVRPTTGHDAPSERARRTPDHDPDRGVLARIRFVWNNPFK